MPPKTSPAEPPFLSYVDASKLYGVGKRCEHESNAVFKTFAKEDIMLGAILRIAAATEQSAATLRRIEATELRIEERQKRQRKYASGLQTRIKKLEEELAKTN